MKVKEQTTPQGKTPTKKKTPARKSLANENGINKATPKITKQNATPKNTKQNATPQVGFGKAGDSVSANSPNQKKNIATPKPANTPKKNAGGTPKVAQTPVGKQKRKQSLVAAAGDGATSPKQQKLNKFPGTATLNNDNQSEKAQDKKSIREQKVAEKKEKKRNQRSALKKAYLLLQEGKPVPEDFIKGIQSRVSQLEAQDSLTKTATRRLASYKKFLKRANATNSPAVNVQAQKPKQGQKQPQKGKKPVQPIEKKVKNDDEDEEEDSDNAEEDEATDDDVEEEEDEDDDDEDESSEEEEEEDNKKVAAKQKPKGPVKPENKQNANKSEYTVYIGNISQDATKDDIVKHFSKSGEIKNVTLPVAGKNKIKGFGFIQFANQQGYEVSYKSI